MTDRVRAIIYNTTRTQLLLIHRIKPADEYWVFPGGGLEEGESHKEALERECCEELGVLVKVEKLAYHEPYTMPDGETLEHYFYECSIVDGVVGAGTGPEFQNDERYKDKGEYIPEWIDIKNLSDLDVRPAVVRDSII